MAFIGNTIRIDLGDGEWVEMRRLSASEFRNMQKAAAQTEPEFEGDDKETAGNFEFMRLLRQRIVVWSDPEPVTPESIERLPIDFNPKIMKGIGGGETDVPLPSGSPSTASSTE